MELETKIHAVLEADTPICYMSEYLIMSRARGLTTIECFPGSVLPASLPHPYGILR
jgi:hypothetical protein